MSAPVLSLLMKVYIDVLSTKLEASNSSFVRSFG